MRKLATDETRPITLEDVQVLAPELQLSGEGPRGGAWVLYDESEVRKLYENPAFTLFTALLGDLVSGVPAGCRFKSGRGESGNGGMVLFTADPLRADGQSYTGLVCVAGSLQFTYVIYHMIRSRLTPRNLALSSSVQGVLQPPRRADSVSGIVSKTLVVYRVPLDLLIMFLKNHEHSQDTKIGSLCVSMYPFIVEKVPTTTIVCDMRAPLESDAATMMLDTDELSEEDSAVNLGVLATFALGSAYPNKERHLDQLTRRAKAMAVSLALPSPSIESLKTAASHGNYKPGEPGSAVLDIIGILVAWGAGEQPEWGASVAQLMSVTEMTNAYRLPPVAEVLLTQMRLVYTNLHSTTIKFVPAFVSALIASGFSEVPNIQGELTRFGAVSQEVQAAPYLGVRGTLPDAFHIKNFPMLAYGALLYHLKSLSSAQERKTFEDYKIADIGTHISSQADRNWVETVVGALPESSIAVMADLVNVLSQENADIIMRARPREVRDAIIEALRNKPTRGSWITTHIDRETATKRLKILTAAKKFLMERHNEIRMAKESEAFSLETPLLVSQQKARIAAWSAQVQSGISGLTSWEAQLEEAVEGVDDRTRASTMEEIKRVAALLDTAPTAPGQPQAPADDPMI